MACDAATQQRLTDAEAAYHQLMTGQMPRVVVDQNGERVEFSATNKGQLYAYITELRTLCAVGPDLGPINPPAMFFF